MANKVQEAIDKLQVIVQAGAMQNKLDEVARMAYMQAAVSAPAIDGLWKLLLAKGVISAAECEAQLSKSYTEQRERMTAQRVIVPSH